MECSRSSHHCPSRHLVGKITPPSQMRALSCIAEFSSWRTTTRRSCCIQPHFGCPRINNRNGSRRRSSRRVAVSGGPATRMWSQPSHTREQCKEDPRIVPHSYRPNQHAFPQGCVVPRLSYKNGPIRRASRISQMACLPRCLRFRFSERSLCFDATRRLPTTQNLGLARPSTRPSSTAAPPATAPRSTAPRATVHAPLSARPPP